MSKQLFGNDEDTELNDFKINAEFPIFNTSLLYYLIIPFFSVTEFLSIIYPDILLSYEVIAPFPH